MHVSTLLPGRACCRFCRPWHKTLALRHKSQRSPRGVYQRVEKSFPNWIRSFCARNTPPTGKKLAKRSRIGYMSCASHGKVAQLVRAHGSYPCCRGFESPPCYHFYVLRRTPGPRRPDTAVFGVSHFREVRQRTFSSESPSLIPRFRVDRTARLRAVRNISIYIERSVRPAQTSTGILQNVFFTRTHFIIQPGRQSLIS